MNPITDYWQETVNAFIWSAGTILVLFLVFMFWQTQKEKDKIKEQERVNKKEIDFLLGVDLDEFEREIS